MPQRNDSFVTFPTHLSTWRNMLVHNQTMLNVGGSVKTESPIVLLTKAHARSFPEHTTPDFRCTKLRIKLCIGPFSTCLRSPLCLHDDTIEQGCCSLRMRVDGSKDPHRQQSLRTSWTGSASLRLTLREESANDNASSAMEAKDTFRKQCTLSCCSKVLPEAFQ